MGIIKGIILKIFLFDTITFSDISHVNYSKERGFQKFHVMHFETWFLDVSHVMHLVAGMVRHVVFWSFHVFQIFHM